MHHLISLADLGNGKWRLLLWRSEAPTASPLELDAETSVIVEFVQRLLDPCETLAILEQRCPPDPDALPN